jgi:hypothetical protein
MPSMDGAALVAFIRAQFPHIPIHDLGATAIAGCL